MEASRAVHQRVHAGEVPAAGHSKSPSGYPDGSWQSSSRNERVLENSRRRACSQQADSWPGKEILMKTGDSPLVITAASQPKVHKFYSRYLLPTIFVAIFRSNF